MFSHFDNEEVEAYFNRLNAQIKKMPTEDRAETASGSASASGRAGGGA